MAGDDRALSLDHLPTELICSIFRFVDPIGIVSVRHTCKRFYEIVKLNRSHWVEYLLALECQEGKGGLTPIFRSRDNDTSPGYDQWDGMRWACTDCLRLLPHTQFDNHMLLRLRYRKPIPGSPAALRASSWAPSSGEGNRRGRRSAVSFRNQFPSRAYGVAISKNWGTQKYSQNAFDRLTALQDAGLDEFMHMSLQEFEALSAEDEINIFDKAARVIELEWCGHRRDLRKCNECRFQRGELKPKHWPNRWQAYGLNLGSNEIPILRGRQLALPTRMDRCFPNLWRRAQSQRPEFPMRMMRFRSHFMDIRYVNTIWWTMYMVRCPGCGKWQELREFRYGNVYPTWTPLIFPNSDHMNWDETRVDDAFISGLKCNKCYADAHGREELLQKLLEMWIWLIDDQLLHVKYRLESPWNIIEREFSRVPKGYKNRVKMEFLPGKPFGGDDQKWVKDTDMERTHDELAIARVRRNFWFHLVGQMENKGLVLSHDLQHAFDDHQDAEDHWIWLKEWKLEVMSRPEVLLEWEFDRDLSAVV